MDLIEKSDNSYRHPWELSRMRSTLSIIQSNPPNLQYADIGSGDCYFTSKIVELTNKPVIAVDSNYELEHERKGQLVCLRNLNSIEPESLDFVFLMDVIEHVKNDKQFLSELSAKIKPGGKILITAPAWQHLFSLHDKFLKHFRRYNKIQLFTLVESADLEVQEVYYFFLSLYLVRLMGKAVGILPVYLVRNSTKEKGIGQWRYPRNHYLTKLLTMFLYWDFKINRFVSKKRLSLPGLSLWMVCKKKYI